MERFLLSMEHVKWCVSTAWIVLYYLAKSYEPNSHLRLGNIQETSYINLNVRFFQDVLSLCAFRQVTEAGA